MLASCRSSRLQSSAIKEYIANPNHSMINPEAIPFNTVDVTG
jgi:hypothetical protein